MARWNNSESNDGGVSESIGFMLIFTIVIAGIALVTLYGYPLLLQQQVGAEEKIMEKNMIVLQNDFKSMAYKTVPYKETSLKIGGGSLTVYNLSDSPSSITIYNNISNPYIQNFQPGELTVRIGFRPDGYFPPGWGSCFTAADKPGVNQWICDACRATLVL